MAPILITGATGSTGRTTIKYLLQKGVSVRAFVHKEDDRSRQLEAQGAEVVVGISLICAQFDAHSRASRELIFVILYSQGSSTPLLFLLRRLKRPRPNTSSTCLKSLRERKSPAMLPLTTGCRSGFLIGLARLSRICNQRFSMNGLSMQAKPSEKKMSLPFLLAQRANLPQSLLRT